MGDIADMMLEGFLCECCGGYLDERSGFPQKCHACLKDVNIGARCAQGAPMKIFSDTDFFARHQYLTVALIAVCVLIAGAI